MHSIAMNGATIWTRKKTAPRMPTDNVNFFLDSSETYPRGAYFKSS